MEGKCLCGNVKVVLDVVERPLSFFCHCTHCRKVAGGLVGANLLVGSHKVKVIGQENLHVFDDTATDSGEVLHRYFCQNCGNPIMSTTKVLPNHVVVKAGIFPEVPKVTAECYTKHRQVWETPVDGAKQFSAAIEA